MMFSEHCEKAIETISRKNCSKLNNYAVTISHGMFYLNMQFLENNPYGLWKKRIYVYSYTENELKAKKKAKS